jgi:steroid 5-alpha reductase family enzyme
MSLLLILGLIVLIQIILFIPAFIFKTDKLTDISYGLTFILAAGIILFLNPLSAGKVILLLMIAIWGFRLGIFLFIRIGKIKRDKRFDGIREKFFKFLGFWLLQGISIWVIMLSSLLYLKSETMDMKLISWFGFIVWLTGFIIETISDFQKFRFIQNLENEGKWIESGLWKYSRHPNYFGEILVWLGVYVFTLPVLFGLNILIGLISPIYIVFLLIFVSGIPKLEKMANEKWGTNPDYLNYKRSTSILFILPKLNKP